MGADADAGPVCGGDGVWPGVAVLDEGGGELVHHVGVGAAVAAALDEGEVVGVLDALSELLNGFGEEVGVVGDFDLFGYLGLGTLGHVDDAGLVLDEGPLEAFLGAVDVDAFAVLAGDVVEEAPDVGGEVAVLELDVAGLDGELVAAFLGDVVADGSRTEAADVLGESVDHAEAWADDVGGVVHGNHAFPVFGPAVHVLRMTGGEVLDLAEFAVVVEFLYVEEFAGVDDGLGHHVPEAGFLDDLADFLAFLDGGGHGHGAHDVFARPEGLEGLRSVVGNGGVDVDGVDLGILEELVIVGVAFFYIELVGQLVHLLLVASADGDEVHVRVGLVDGDELGSEAEPDDGDVMDVFAHCGWME